MTALNGVIIVDKPRGPTSFDVVAAVRRASGVKRVGHAGTLDPMASGVLPVCVGEATKLVPFLQAGEKEYQAEARLGVATDTFDAEGKITAERDATKISRADVERVLATFAGVIRQLPPMHSALRVGGKRLYEFAREGVEVERAPREVVIRYIHLDEFSASTGGDGDVRARFTVACGKGTYIRSLAADLGELLGVGAHLTALRRTRVGRFTLADSVPLDALAPGLAVLGPADALAHLPALTLDADQARDVRDGKAAVVAALDTDGKTEDPFVRLLRADGTLLAVCDRAGGRLRLARVFS